MTRPGAESGTKSEREVDTEADSSISPKALAGPGAAGGVWIVSYVVEELFGVTLDNNSLGIMTFVVGFIAAYFTPDRLRKLGAMVNVPAPVLNEAVMAARVAKLVADAMHDDAEFRAKQQLAYQTQLAEAEAAAEARSRAAIEAASRLMTVAQQPQFTESERVFDDEHEDDYPTGRIDASELIKRYGRHSG